MNAITRYYRVGEHVFAIEADETQLEQLTNYAPFAIEAQEECLFRIRVADEAMPGVEQYELVYTDTSDEDMPRIEMYRKEGEWLFRIAMYKEGEIVSAMRCSMDWKDVTLYMEGVYTRFAIDNAAMLVYAFSTVHLQTLLFHSSVTVLDGVGYMFLGHSGTGKSTHSQQWLKAFEEAYLLNDDNPVVRMEGEEVTVYGSPWSGKTPCYKNEQVPVGFLVQLAQAPHNQIARLKMTQAYPYILASVSGLKLLPEMMDSLYETIAALLERRPVYKLECLPNEDAARLCAAQR